MYCVIQKVIKKKPVTPSISKDLVVTSFSFTNNFGRDVTKYGYSFSLEKFERPIRDAYKISIHESYRENGKVKKKQWVICTMGYYDIIEFSLWDCAGFRITDLAKEIGVSEEKLYSMINLKLNSLTEQIEKEYQQTEEYKTKNKHDAIIDKYRRTKAEFNKKHKSPLSFADEADEYDFVYDVFGELRNPSYLEVLESMRKWNDDYTKRSYQSNNQSNYNNYDFGSYSIGSASNYNNDEKKMLKKIYREASKKFHPDVYSDDGSMMKFLTKLKEEWGI